MSTNVQCKCFISPQHCFATKILLMTSTPGSYDKDDEDREDVDKEEEWAEVRFAASDLSKVKVCQNDSHERERRLDERCVADALDKEERNNEEFGLEPE